MANAVIISKSLAAASVNCIAQAQSVAAGGSVVLNGSAAGGVPIVATLDTQRRVLITSAGNDSGISFTITGTNESGAVQSEVLVGGNIAAVASVLDYLTITSIKASGGTASTVQVGTNTVGSTPWFMPNWHMAPFSMHWITEVAGTVNYQLDQTLDDYWTPTNPSPQPHVSFLNAGAAQAAGIEVSITTPIRGWRATVNSGAGTVFVQSDQAGIVNY